MAKNETVRTTVEMVVDVFVTLFGNRFKGYRTQMVAVAKVLTGTWAFFDESVTVYLCSTFEIACDFETTKIFSICLIVIGAIDYFMRKLTDTPAGPPGQFLRRFTGKYREDVQALKIRALTRTK